VRKSWGEVKDTLLRGGRKSIVCEKGSQASPARPSGKSRVKVKALERLEIVA
jgi:hypothetical protein